MATRTVWISSNHSIKKMKSDSSGHCRNLPQKDPTSVCPLKSVEDAHFVARDAHLSTLLCSLMSTFEYPDLWQFSH
ncbi:hypothetical protein RRG08_033683 [Elysia crispata]|uniref:Uncharacterized protein n=1 Tax=Elysia crispata TaxID=231223 RepID=A0AAE1DUP3_9GAST|nr:hypothetical protein RRG08_033683 [Elysia crispata]